ncbi:hypothetical protein M885DRAFT_522191 [Pelagophyceae sp. CCMP2097]|nr:hypothetical protein M885DRAFT_522191 [Pelagophyceae sp. CCMP2097]
MAEVVELPECAFRRKFKPSQATAAASRSSRPGNHPQGPKKPRKILMLRDAKKDVYELGVSGLGKRAKRALEAERSEAFGIKEANQKMPFKMLVAIRKAEAEKDKRKAAERREAGIVAPVEKRDAVLGGKIKRKSRGGGGDNPLDEVRDGVLRVKAGGAKADREPGARKKRR